MVPENLMRADRSMTVDRRAHMKDVQIGRHTPIGHPAMKTDKAHHRIDLLSTAGASTDYMRRTRDISEAVSMFGNDEHLETDTPGQARTTF